MHSSSVTGSKVSQTEMGINIYTEARQWTYNQGYGQVLIYQYGADGQWYLIVAEGGYVGNYPLPFSIRPSLLHSTSDNWRCYAVNISTLGQAAWWDSGDNIWKSTSTGYVIEDDDLYYNPPCWVTESCPDLEEW